MLEFGNMKFILEKGKRARAVYSETFADYGDPELLKILQAIG